MCVRVKCSKCGKPSWGGKWHPQSSLFDTHVSCNQ